MYFMLEKYTNLYINRRQVNIGPLYRALPWRIESVAGLVGPNGGGKAIWKSKTKTFETTDAQCIRT